MSSSGDKKRDPEGSNDPSNPKRAKSTDIESKNGSGKKETPDLKEINVEFKFRSCKTYILDDGQWDGTLQMKLMQDQRSGRFILPDGRHVVRWKTTWHGYKDKEESFEGEIVKSESSTEFKLGMDLIIKTPGDGVYESIEISGTKDDRSVRDRESIADITPFTNKRKVQLKNWIKMQGGVLSFQARGYLDLPDEIYEHHSDIEPTLDATYKLKLYTVLSVHIPNKKPRRAKQGHDIDWSFLEGVVASRFPKVSKEWAERAVHQYKLFLELKIENEDWDSSKFSPSGPIDEVWHAHISFTERYQEDIFSLTGNEHLIGHSPVLGDMSKDRYKAGYIAHAKRMSERGESVDSDFWPCPKDLVERKPPNKRSNDGEESSDSNEDVESSDDSDVHLEVPEELCSDTESDDDLSIDSHAHLDMGFGPQCG